MAANVYRRSRAKRDLVEHYTYLAEQAGMNTAERFLSNAYRSFSELSKHPRMGEAIRLSNPRLARMRKWRIEGFENYLIFYIPRPDGISIGSRLACRAELVEAAWQTLKAGCRLIQFSQVSSGGGLRGTISSSTGRAASRNRAETTTARVLPLAPLDLKIQIESRR